MSGVTLLTGHICSPCVRFLNKRVKEKLQRIEWDRDRRKHWSTALLFLNYCCVSATIKGSGVQTWVITHGKVYTILSELSWPTLKILVTRFQCPKLFCFQMPIEFRFSEFLWFELCKMSVFVCVRTCVHTCLHVDRVLVKIYYNSSDNAEYWFYDKMWQSYQYIDFSLVF